MAFSMMCNNYSSSPRTVEEFFDSICGMLVRFTR
jgi:hypothetical protein